MAEKSDIQEPIPEPSAGASPNPGVQHLPSTDVNLAGQDLPHGFKLVIIFTSLVLSVLLVALDYTIIATAIPRITVEFHSLDQVGWYGSAYFLTNASFQSSWGKAYTYFGLKSTFIMGVSLFEMGTLICATSPSSTAFIVGRAVAGLGGAGITGGAFTIVAAIAAPKKRAMYIGFMGGTYGVASLIGPIIGGIFTQYVTWRWCFWVNLPVGGLASTMIIFFFHPPPSEVPPVSRIEQVRQMDLLGALPLAGSLICYLMSMRWGGVTFLWSAAPVIGTLTASGVLLVAFVTVECASGGYAMVQTQFFKRSEIVLNFVYMYFLAGLYMPAVYFLSIQFQAIGNMNAAQAGIQLIPLALCVSMGTIIANTCISKLGYPSIWLVLGPILGTLGATLIYTHAADARTGGWIGFQVIIGFGIGFALQTPISINQSLVAAKDIAVIIGVTLFFEVMGACMMIAASEATFANRLVSTLANNEQGIDAMTVVEASVSQLRSMFRPEELSIILAAYQEGLNATYTLFMACGAISTMLSFSIVLLEYRRAYTGNRRQVTDTQEG